MLGMTPTPCPAHDMKHRWTSWHTRLLSHMARARMIPCATQPAPADEGYSAPSTREAPPATPQPLGERAPIPCLQ